MRIGGGGGASSREEAPRYKTPGEDLFDAFFEAYADAGVLTLLALREAIEEKPAPTYLEASPAVRKFFDDIAERFGISDP